MYGTCPACEACVDVYLQATAATGLPVWPILKLVEKPSFVNHFCFS